jgi:di/tricarboxylate transporter
MAKRMRVDTPPAAARTANIGRRERRKRLVFGITALVAAIVISGLLVYIQAPVVWRLPLFLLFYVGALGYFQARDKT